MIKWAVVCHLHMKGLEAEQRVLMMLAHHRKHRQNLTYSCWMLVTIVTHLADMKKSMIAMKPTMYRYNPRLLFMREQTPSAACNPETAPMQQVRTDPASRTKWPIQYPTVTALLRAAMSGRVVVCMLKRPTWKCLVPWSAAPTDQLVFLNFI